MASQTNAHIATGQLGEQVATEFLQKKGYEILARNYRHRRAEVDIIARKEDELIFAEVKTRATSRFGYPELAVNSKKEAQLLAAAEEYIYQNGWEMDVRFDIIAITLGNPIEIHHIEDAFH